MTINMAGQNAPYNLQLKKFPSKLNTHLSVVQLRRSENICLIILKLKSEYLIVYHWLTDWFMEIDKKFY